MSSKLGAVKRPQVLAALQALLALADFVPILSRVRPLSPDPDDDFVIECAYNARASLVTYNRKDLLVAQTSLPLSVLAPEEFLSALEG